MPPADTTPNALFIDDPAVVSDKRLDGWFVSFFEDCCVLLTFRHNFNLEASDLDPNLGFDGAVLELSTDGGNTFQDILAAGGGFVSGGYNRTIAADRGSLAHNSETERDHRRVVQDSIQCCAGQRRHGIHRHIAP